VRILQVHHRYSSAQPSGENMTTELLAGGLDALGHHVIHFSPTSDDLVGRQVFLHAAGPLGFGPTARRLRRLLRMEQFDVALVHNVYPTLGPGAISLLGAAGVPVVHVLHNYRHSCIAGNHWRDGAPCFDCTGSLGRIPGVIHRCYRGSAVQSLLLAGGETLRGGGRSSARVIVHLSAWMKDRVMTLKPLDCADQRVIHDPIAAVPEPPADRRDVLYVGRLAPEKGIDLLLSAWKRMSTSWRLHIAGDGPLRADVLAAATTSSRIVFHGHLPPDKIAALRHRTAVAVVPALWDEPFGRVAAEAHAAGQPVLATPRGALPEIVVPGTGALVRPDVGSWSEALQAVVSQPVPPDAQRRARENWRSRFSIERASRDYANALEAAARGGAGSHQ
jgi:glycosyltransferase involved in cell wall biosynthesis